MNQNMIIVLGVSIIIVTILNSLNLVKEGFEDSIENIENIDETIESIEAKIRSTMDTISKLKKEQDQDDIPNVMDNESLGKKLSNILDNYEDFENVDQDEESNYMQDKTIIKKLKKLNPVVMETIMNMTSRDIDTMNKSINDIKNETIIDP
jgi:hypothetical protein